MTTTQKHLNNIKSVFGGIKNWWTKGKSGQPSTVVEEPPSKLKNTVEKSAKQSPYHKNVDTTGFYDDDNDLDSKFMAGAKSRPPTDQQYIQRVTNSAREEEINTNLGISI